MRVMPTALAVLSVAVISSCTTLGRPSNVPASGQVSTEMLLDASPLAEGVEPEDLSQVDILELSPEMIAFMDRWVDPHGSEYLKLWRLLYAVMGDGTFDVIYDGSTRTAQETFRQQRGNCLSFTNMFVAMSRYLGLDSNFQEVMMPPDWSISGETLIFNLHINSQVDLNSHSDQMVDFNMYDFRIRYERQIISDSRASAHYFNNMGVEYMLEGDTPMALANFRESIKLDSTFGPAWVNLGILYNREGYPNYAEAAYLQALYIDDRNQVAMSNLAGLYEQEGRTELAEQYRSKVKYHRKRNPYYRYQLARTAFDNGDYGEAIDHLKFAVRRIKNDDNFYFLMSLSYLNSGDKEAAERWMRKAEEVAEIDADKKRYHRKLDMLMSDGTG
jgi:Flp pilus assembly protein TadD